MANLLDLMSKSDRESAISAYNRRMSGDNTYRKQKISPIAYMIAQLGMMYGWPAIEAAKRGYIEVFDEHTGKRSKMPLSMEEISVLVDAGQKIKNSDFLNQARCTQVATGSVLSKSPETSFKKGMKPFIEGAKL